MSAKEQNTVCAERQMRGNPRIEYCGDSGIKVLIVGNSITRHSPAPEIGWENDCGMAASAAEKDYVHVLFTKLNEHRPHRFLVLQAADFERSFEYEQSLRGEMELVKAYSPDIIVGRLSENVFAKDCAGGAWQNVYGQLLSDCGREETRYILTTAFWRSEEVDGQTRALASERGWKLVELGDLGDDPAMLAGDKFWHSGVAVHPGDEGMHAIADRLYKAVLEVENA